MSGRAEARVDRHLSDGESPVMHCRPHLVAWAVSQVTDLAVMLTVAVIVLVTDVAVVRVLGLLALAGLVVWFVLRGVQVWFTRYVLTTHRAMRVSGVLRSDCEWMTWSKVTDVQVQRSALDRLLQTATIKIHSANERSSFKTMDDVPDPIPFAEKISEMVNARQGAVVLGD